MESAISNATGLLTNDNLQGVGPSLPFALDRKYPMLFDQPSGHLFFPTLGYATTPLPALYADIICTHRS